MRTAVMWFRRDLRVHDHPALVRAAREFELVVPVFVLDPALLSGRYESTVRNGFLIGCLEDLDLSLRDRGSGLVLLSGRPEDRLPEFAGRVAADALFWTSDISPYARHRDRKVTEALREAGVQAIPQAGNYVAEIAKLRTVSGSPYRVFSPFHRRWTEAPRREINGAPRNLGELPAAARELTFGNQINRLAPRRPAPREGWLAAPGESAGRKSLDRWLAAGVTEYPDRQNCLSGRKSTSILSPYLRWGCISPAEAEQLALEREGAGTAAWVRQICWRDFYAHVLLHWPENLDTEFQASLRELEWETDPERLAAWQEGLTGYPIVDAAMRQLSATGWMHNRARLIAGSFLTKDLQLDWREGERWFARLLLDGEPAQNNGNWQWIASVGTDPAPLTRRLYNPVKQGERHDPDGAYVRKWVPELAGLPAGSIHAPWTASATDQRRAGCAIGKDYPEPIVDHAFERRIALERYGRAKAANKQPLEPADEKP